jgi:hypothetical protein
MPVCTKCKTNKSDNEFDKHKNKRDGHQSWCKQCRKEHRFKNRDEINKKNKERYYDDHEKSLISCKEYRDSHKEQIAKTKKNWAINHKEEKKNHQKEYYENNKKAILAKQKKRRDEHREKDRKYQREYHSNRRQTDPDYYILCSLRREINLALHGINKCARTVELVGIPIHEYKVYLQFTADMNGLRDFDSEHFNGEKFHIDHIVPRSWFNLTDTNQQRECFYFMNTQILRAEDNLDKSNRFCG